MAIIRKVHSSHKTEVHQVEAPTSQAVDIITSIKIIIANSVEEY